MKKIGLICMALVLALGSLGVGFAMWSETLYIEGYVEAGELDVMFPAAEVTIAPSIPPKDVAGAVWGIESIGEDNDLLWVDIWNVCPSIGGDIIFEVTNVGTIPVHVDSVWVHFKDDGKYGYVIDEDGNFVDVPVPFVFCDYVELIPSEWIYLDLDNDCDADLGLHLKSDFVSSQIDPAFLWADLAVPEPETGIINWHVEQGADELQEMYFNIEIDFIQWNE